MAYGLLWSSVSRNVLLAGAMSVVSVAAAAMAFDRWLPPADGAVAPGLVEWRAIPARLLLASAALAASALAITGRARTWGAWIPEGRAERGGSIRIRRASVGRSLAWQAFREGRMTWYLVFLLAVVLPVACLFDNRAGLGVMSAVLAGLIAGVAVFGPDGGPGSRRFLAHHGVAPGAAWGWRMATWAPGLALYLAGFLILSWGRPSRESWAFSAAVLDVFAVGLLCGMAIPRRITAALVGVIGAIALVPIQVVAVEAEMAPAWTPLLTPAALIGASRAWAGDWLGEREGSRPWARLGLFVAVPLGLIGSGYVAYRAWGVPDVGPQFDPVAARGEAIPPGQDAVGGYRRALLAIPSDAGRAPVVDVIARGWDPKREDVVVAWWSRNREAIDLARDASALPRARFEDVGSMTVETPGSPIVQGTRTLSTLLALDARERQARGDLAGSWADILAQFRLAGHLASGSPTMSRALVAADVHHRAVALAVEWSGDPRQSAGSIRAARDDLGRLPPPPSAAACLRVESGILDRTSGLPPDELRSFLDPNFGGDSTLGNLAFAYLIAPPWERARARRLARRLIAEEIPVAEREPWERGDSAALLDQPPVGSPLLKLIYPASGSVVRALDGELVGRRAVDLVLAIKAWQIGHGGEAPARLEDLVPGELARVPVDPISGRPFGYARSRGQTQVAPNRFDRRRPSEPRTTRPGQPVVFSRPKEYANDPDWWIGGDLAFPVP